MIDDERLLRALELFGEACELEDSERSSFLDISCANDSALREEVDRLLASDQKTLAALSDKAIERQRAALDTAPPPSEVRTVPKSIGCYEILGQIGEGGMGVVYEAQQENPRRRVALKVLGANAVSPSHLARFKFEAQVLGRLQHSAIAQIYEAGTFDLGTGPQPFFAMEFVDGVNLSTWSKGRSTNDRLELFQRICNAVHHAHQKGVVHRDLKPENVFVTVSGDPKILDFGIARATDEDVQRTTMQTAVGQLIGTLPYMSPEQASGDVTHIDARSDIYTLGILLYELLTERLPYNLQRKSIPEAVRIIQEDEPTSMGTIVTSLRGDLDTIVQRALEKDAERRYASAADLGAEVRRFINHEPIIARPPSTTYQLRKFARRNRVLVAGVTSTFVVAVVGAILAIGFAVRADTARGDAETARTDALAAQGQAETSRNEALDARDDADAARQEAETARDLAEQRSGDVDHTIGFLEQAFLQASPNRLGSKTTVWQALDASSLRIDEYTEGRPRVRATIHASVGRTYHQLGRYEEAIAQLQAARTSFETIYEGDHALKALCLCDLGVATAYSGELKSGLAMLEEGMMMSRRVKMKPTGELTERIIALGTVLIRNGQSEEASQTYQHAVDIYQETNNEFGLAAAYGGLAEVARLRLDRTEEERLLREALRLIEASGREASSNHLAVRYRLNEIKSQTGDHAGALVEFRSLIVSAEHVLGKQSPKYAEMMAGFAASLHRNKQQKESRATYTKALHLLEQSLSPDHPTVAKVRISLASLLLDAGDLEAAGHQFDLAIAVMDEKFAETHYLLRRARIQLGMLRRRQGKITEAIEALQILLASIEKTGEQSPKYRSYCEITLGQCHLDLGNFEKAEKYLRQAIIHAAADWGEESKTVRSAETVLAQILDAAKRQEESSQNRK